MTDKINRKFNELSESINQWWLESGKEVDSRVNDIKMLELAKDIKLIIESTGFDEFKPLLEKYLGSKQLDPLSITRLTMKLSLELANLVILDKIKEIESILNKNESK